MGETNFEKVLDTNKDTEGLQLPEGDKAFEEKFKDKTNRVALVNEATKGFDTLDDETKKNIKDKTAEEIKSRGAEPKEGDEGYSAKIAVLYLYTTLSKGTKNASLDEVKTTYNELIVADVKEKQTANETAAKLEAGKKDATGALTTKLDAYTKSQESYSEANRKVLTDAESAGEKSITEAKTLDEVTTAKDKALKAMDDVLTIDEEKEAELKKSVNDKTAEQEESTKSSITYVEKDGKRGHYEQQDFNLPPLITKKGGAANIMKDLSYKQDIFVEDEALNNFMESYEKNESPFYAKNADTFNYLAKNYPSFSKPNKDGTKSEINSEINIHIADYLENDNTNTDYPDLKLKSKETTGVTLEINPVSGLYYFDIPVENLKKSTLKKYPDLKSIHLYSQGDMGDNVIINEFDTNEPMVENKDVVLTRKEPLIEGSENLVDTYENGPGMFDDVGGTPTKNKTTITSDTKSIKEGYDTLTDEQIKAFQKLTVNFDQSITKKLDTKNDPATTLVASEFTTEYDETSFNNKTKAIAPFWNDKAIDMTVNGEHLQGTIKFDGAFTVTSLDKNSTTTIPNIQEITPNAITFSLFDDTGKEKTYKIANQTDNTGTLTAFEELSTSEGKSDLTATADATIEKKNPADK